MEFCQDNESMSSYGVMREGRVIIIPSFFIDKASCTRQFESELSLHSLASLFPIKEGFFRKPTRPSLPLRKAPPLISVFSPQGRRGKPPSGAQNRYALRLADHQRSTPGCAGWDRQGIRKIKVYCNK